ncbi:hypothetical protein MKSMC1_25900 [Mycobacterium kansasii]|nr:hypothetical protein MKSMC1_25900 [Mycobacterium kansasii]
MNSVGSGWLSVPLHKVRVCQSAGFAEPRAGCRRWGCT